MLKPELKQWLDAQAYALDTGTCDAEQVLPRLAAAGLLNVGISHTQGGRGDLADAVEILASVASHSLAAAFVLWGQRALIECVLESPNTRLRDLILPGLLSGECAGAAGLSNAMKFLSDIESLQIRARPHSQGWTLNGHMHWVTNLRKNGFTVAAVVEDEEGGAPFVVAIPSTQKGLQRTTDLTLMGLQSTNTAAVNLYNVELSHESLLHEDARQFLPIVRPALLGLQCGMAIDLARRSLTEVEFQLKGRVSVLHADLTELLKQLEATVEQLKQGLLDQRFMSDPAALFRLRINQADCAARAVQLELMASGGKAYLSDHGSAFGRRLRESAFLPIVTPSIVQLRSALGGQT
ncbi:MAG: acyl-CoA dehydrogenase [Pseudomonas sp.]